MQRAFLRRGQRFLRAAEFTKIRTEFQNGVYNVTLNNPEIFNAFCDTTIAELSTAFDPAQSPLPDDCRAAVLTGEGKAFSAGADLKWMKKTLEWTAEENAQDSEKLFSMFGNIASYPVPVIARVNGAALGGGVGLVASCDIAFAKASCKFGLTEVRLGLIPATISPFVIRKIGVTHASRYFLTGERFNAEEAVRIGLVQNHFEDEAQLDAAVGEVLAGIKASGPEAVRHSKQLIRKVTERGGQYDPDSVRKMTCEWIAERRTSEEGQHGLGSFFAKKQPRWITE